MSIPNFTEQGILPEGIHQCSGNEFITRFCSKGSRDKFRKSFINILDFAKDKSARNVFIGGSFITDKEEPSDIDCLIEFYLDRQIPSFIDCPLADNTCIDILYSSAESRNLTDSFICLFGKEKYRKEKKGIIQIQLDSTTEPWKVIFTPDDDQLEIISRTYSDRRIIERLNNKGILVSIHGLYTRAEWNKDIMPIASSQGWIVAPYIYDKNDFKLLLNKDKRQKIVDDFRDWIYDLKMRYEKNISIVAHSFGTYIIAKYLSGFSDEYCPISLDSIILTGGIITPDFDWDQFQAKSVGRVLNIVALGDDAVKYMPEGDWKRLFGMDTMFGRSGLDGHNLSDKNKIVTEKQLNILTHTNAIKKDIIETIIMPFMNANHGILYDDFISDLLEKK